MQIRKISQDDDFDAISSIYAKSWQAAYRGIIPDDYLDKLDDTNWSGVLKKNTWHTLVVEEDGLYAGTSSVCAGRDEDKRDWGEIVSIYLLPEYIGRGYGSALLDAAVAELKSMGFRFVYLWVLEENKQARAFYGRNGFTESKDRHIDNVGGKNLTVIRYIKLI